MIIATCTGLSGPRSWQQPSPRAFTAARSCCCCLLSRVQGSHKPQALQTEPNRQRTALQQKPDTNMLNNDITNILPFDTVIAAAGRSAAVPDYRRHRLIGSSELAQIAVLSPLVKRSRGDDISGRKTEITSFAPGLQGCSPIAWP